MPKLKTPSALKRRFKVTGTGKVMRSKMGRNHLRRKKTKRTKSVTFRPSKTLKESL